MKRLLLSLTLAIACFSMALAIGAYPDPIEVTQPDGTTLKVMLHGDEWYRWTTTTDGYRIVKNDRGIYEYAQTNSKGQAVASGIKAFAESERTTEQKAFVNGLQKNIGINAGDITKSRSANKRFSLSKSASAAANFPSTGNRKLLVILAEFSDVTKKYDQSNFANLMNQPTYKGTGSFKDYYLENSNGKLNIESTVTQWVKLPNTREYYAAETKWPEFARDAIAKAEEAGINFAEFDNNGDLNVDAIAIFHVGKGQESSGDPKDIWSNSNNLSGYYLKENRLFDGVYVDSYTIQPEFNNNTTDMCNIGVLCHEFGHSLGLPDYYDTDYEVNGSQTGTGKWDIMGNGAYNNQSATPAHHNALSKFELTWATIQTLTTVGQQQLAPINSSKIAYRINTTTPNEYFLLENRIRTGFDASLPGEGMIIYHVDGDYIASTKPTNTINTGSHQGFYVKIASGFINSSSCPFPGSTNAVMFTDFSTPSALSWAGLQTSKSVTNIAVGTDKVVSFDFLSLENGAPISISATAIDHTSIGLTWQANVANDPVLIAYSTDGVFGTPDNSKTYAPGETIAGGGTVLYFDKVATSLPHNALTPITTYYYKIWSKFESSYSASLNTKAKTMALPVSSYPWHEGFETGLENWQNIYVENANKWATKNGGYDAKPSSAFEGSANAYFFFPNSSVPTTSKLVSPLFIANNGENFRLSFQHAQQKWGGDQDELRVYIKYDGSTTWQLLTSYTQNTPNWKKEYINFQATGSFQIAFEGKSDWGYGVVVDDVFMMRNEVAAPNPGVTNLKVDSKTAGSLTISWTKGAGNKTMVVCREASPVLGLPDNGTAYTASSVFKSGSTLNPNDYVVYNDAGNQVEITNLKIGTQYQFAAFDYFESGLIYQSPAATLADYTVYSDVTFSFTVTNNNMVPIENASVVCGTFSGLTDAAGKLSLTMPHSASNLTYSATSTSMQKSWGKSTGDMNKSIAIVMEPEEEVVATQITNTEVNNNVASISWNPVIDENFTGYEPFALSIPNWTFIDNDKTKTYGLFGEDITYTNEGYTGSFIVMNPYVAGGIDIPALPYSADQFLGCAAADGKQNDDWLISPEISVTGTTWLSFMAQSYYSNYGLERFKVLISENGIDLANFTTISAGNYVTVPVGWQLYKYDLSAFVGKKIHFAVNCVSNNAALLMIDNIKITNTEPQTAPESPMVFAPYIAASKQPAAIAATPTMHKSAQLVNDGSILYELYRNNALAGTFSGMASTTGTNNVVPCEKVEYTVKVLRKNSTLNATSSPSVLATCQNVTVHVTSNATDMAGAAVKLGNITKMTDQNGNAIFNDTEWGSYTLEVTANEYKTYSETAVVGKAVKFEVVMDLLTNIDNSKHEWIAYPNPSNGIFNISTVANILPLHYSVYNANGDKILDGTSNLSNFDVDLTKSPTGIYWLKIVISDQVKTLKLVKQ